MNLEQTLTERITDILIDGGCTINKPSVKKVVDLIYALQLDHINGFERLFLEKSKKIRTYLEDGKKREGEQ